jgi:ribose 5-phosphate isomerase
MFLEVQIVDNTAKWQKKFVITNLPVENVPMKYTQVKNKPLKIMSKVISASFYQKKITINQNTIHLTTTPTTLVVRHFENKNSRS